MVDYICIPFLRTIQILFGRRRRLSDIFLHISAHFLFLGLVQTSPVEHVLIYHRLLHCQLPVLKFVSAPAFDLCHKIVGTDHRMTGTSLCPPTHGFRYCRLLYQTKKSSLSALKRHCKSETVIIVVPHLMKKM